MAYGIFIAEKMTSTKDVAKLRSMTKTATIENGSIVTKGALSGTEKELYVAGDVAANTDVIYLVDGVAVTYSEETTKGLDDFINAANVAFRTRKPEVDDVFSVSESVVTCLANAGAGPAVVGNFVETPASGNKLAEKATSLSSGVSFGAKIIDRYLFGTRAIPMLRVEVTKVL
jgi:hypothetical protein